MVFAKVDLTVEGKKMLENFLLGVCGFTGTFRLADRLDKCIQAIKQVPFKSFFRFFGSGFSESGLVIRIQAGQNENCPPKKQKPIKVYV